MNEQRLNPDKLLQRAQAEERKELRGRLKIYLGAAPGVGKTYAMLHDALDEKAKGLDIIVGVAESHGRNEIESLLKNFDILPRQTVEYRGTQLYEFDLNAALNRHAGLILIDEMAHTNAPGSRHKKRWQDIKELLDRGIDVYTTLNVQHIESLNDAVSRIVHAPIKETVPDSMIEMANTIELVDIPPDELLERLREGKVYLPEQAVLAAEMFFRKGNLIALRELALRTTAERVGEEVLLYRQGQGISTIWPTSDKILVCVGSGPESLKVIRAAKRMATGLQCDWMAVYVETSRIDFSEEKRHRAMQNLRFAEQLGGQTRVLTGYDIVKEVMRFAREQNVTQIMIWKHIKKRWMYIFSRSLVDEIVRNSREIDVYIMTGNLEKPIKQKNVKNKRKTAWWTYGISILVVVVATAIGFILNPYLNASNLIMVYLLGVTFVALLGRMGPSIAVSILSVLAYDFFFIPPYYSFAVADIQYFFTLIVMLIVAQVISQLTLMMRRQEEAARHTEHQTSALHTLSRKLAGTRGSDNLLNVGIKYIADLFDSDILALLTEHNKLVIQAKYRSNKILDEKELGVAQWVYELGQMAGLGTDSLSLSEALYLPLRGSNEVIGVLRIHPAQIERFASPESLHLLEACSNILALALEVDHFQDQANQSELKIETDRVRNAVLQSIAYDLRIPVQNIIDVAKKQMDQSENLHSSEIKAAGRSIYFGAEQVNRLVSNLLQISLLDADQVKLNKQKLSFDKHIKRIAKKVNEQFDHDRVYVNLPENFPLIFFDGTLIQVVFINLIDNAIKFSPSDSSINIIATVDETHILVKVHDFGVGVMEDEINQLFDKFYRGRMLTEERGLGLGLAVCRSIIKAHGGEIWVENAKEGGTVFIFTLPLNEI